ncbi:MAG: response regulator [Desulfuromonadales bacterium]|nr:MAG: response regulator [Desulfuromonadales bacterium]
MSNPSILLVDDEKFFLNLQQEFLKDSPVTILTASGGEEALDAIRRHRPNLIFMDFRMPDLDGATCCAILKNDPKLAAIPVVMVAAEGKENDRELCRKAGCDAIIAKPLDRRQFLATGRRFLPAVERRYARIPYSALAVFRKGESSFHGTIEDISLWGVYVASRCDVQIDERIRLGFVLPDTELLEAEARVAWVNLGHRRIKPAMPEGFGVEFTAIPDAARERVRMIVERTGSGAA